MQQPIKIKEKIIGTWDTERRIFTKRVKGSKHLMVSLDAWGIDAGVLERIWNKSGLVRIEDQESGDIYEATAQLYKEKGIERTFKDYGKQLFLPRSYFTKAVPGAQSHMEL